MPNRTYAVMGATGHIGRVLTEELLKKGHGVRALGRTLVKMEALRLKGAEPFPLAFDDAAALAAAFRGTDGVFVMIPPAYDEDDFSAYQNRTGEAIAKAVKDSGVKHVVHLSSIGADRAEGTGPIVKLHLQEARLAAIPGVNVLQLRPGYFMENLLWSIPVILGMGVLGTPIRPDLRVGMVATKDIGAVAADFLDKLAFNGNVPFEFAGPRDVTLAEVASLIGAVIGKFGLPYVQFPYEDAKKGMVGSGMKPDMADLMIQMNRAFNEGRVEPTQKLEGAHRGRTSVEEFVRDMAPAFAKA